MANQDIVSKNKLINLADKIRENTEISRSLTIDEINDGVTNMANKFSDLIKRNSTEIFVPASVDTIGEYAFAGCTNLVAIDFSSHTSIPTLVNVNAFSNIASGCKAFIPNDLYDEWIASDIWADVTTLTFVKAVSEGLTYTLTDNTYSVSGIGTCTDTDVRIPLTYNGLSVTSIGDKAFFGCSSLKNIRIPDSVTSIGTSAFSDCTNLTGITIPDSVTTIKSSAFRDCTRLISITIPDSVTSIGTWALTGCSDLMRIIVLSDNPKYDSRDNCNALIETSTNTLIAGCKNTVIPDSVITIGSIAFRDCTSLTNITIPDSVTTIKNDAFYYCTSLTSITIPDSVTSIGDKAFYYCRSLASVEVGNGVTSIGDYAFAYCNILTSITIPNSVTSIGKSTFISCSGLTSITIPDSVTSLGDSTFSSCRSLRSIEVGHNNLFFKSIDGNLYTKDGTTLIQYAIGKTNTLFEIPDSVTTIINDAFAYCSLTSITIPDSITSIGYRAFSECTSLTSITIPNSVTNIGESAFILCSSLTSITISNSVAHIGDKAFSYCSSLATIDCSSHTTVPTLSNVNAFINVGLNVASGCQAILPDALYDEWIAANVWKDVTILTYVKKSEVTE